MEFVEDNELIVLLQSQEVDEQHILRMMHETDPAGLLDSGVDSEVDSGMCLVLMANHIGSTERRTWWSSRGTQSIIMGVVSPCQFKKL